MTDWINWRRGGSHNGLVLRVVGEKGAVENGAVENGGNKKKN